MEYHFIDDVRNGRFKRIIKDLVAETQSMLDAHKRIASRHPDSELFSPEKMEKRKDEYLDKLRDRLIRWDLHFIPDNCTMIDLWEGGVVSFSSYDEYKRWNNQT